MVTNVGAAKLAATVSPSRVVTSAITPRIGQVPDQGMPIAPGSAANITVWDPSAQGTLEIDSLAGKSGNSPYLGRRMPGAVRHVLFRGRPTVVDGALA